VNYKHNERFCKAFGKQVRKIRVEKNLSMRELALQSDMEYSQLSKFERAVINTTISTVYALSQALDVPVTDLFNFKFTDK
jgi:transcriptional regulator with XRE-family HTH domain